MNNSFYSISSIMKKLFPVLFLPLLVAGCKDPCKNIDCLPPELFFFTIQSADNGEDLLFGDQRQLSEEDIEVFSVSDEKRIPAETSFDSDRVVIMTNHQLIGEYFVEARNEIDTINLLMTIRDTECCGRQTEVEQISLNGTVLGSETDILVLYR
jgi:hypothetical protein